MVDVDFSKILECKKGTLPSDAPSKLLLVIFVLAPGRFINNKLAMDIVFLVKAGTRCSRLIWSLSVPTFARDEQ